MNTLVVNLTRFGDLLQTQPVLSGLKRGGHATGLVCLDNFAGATELLRDLDHVAVFRGGGALARIEQDWRESVGELWNWCEQSHAEFPPDAVVNLTATLSARLLARRMTPDEGALRGFAVDDSGFGSNTDPWTTFLQASTRMRGCSPYNLVDLYCQAAGVWGGAREFSLAEPDEDLVQALWQGLQDDIRSSVEGSDVQGFVAFQLGASQERRRWPLEQFVQLGDALWREHGLVPVLLGSKGERELAERYVASAKGIAVDRVGGTTFTELAATLRSCSLLVSNDTGTMHLAAGLGVPVLAVFLATAQPWDTGAYLEGACSLEPDMPCHPCPFGTVCQHEHACRERISYKTLLALIASWREKGVWGAPKLSEARVWQAERDVNGFMDLKAVSGHDTEDRTRWVRQQRFFYRQFLDRGESGACSECQSGAETGQQAAGNILPPEEMLPLSSAMQESVLAELTQSAQLLHLFTEQGNVLRMQPVGMLKERFLTTWQRLQTLWGNSKYLNVLGFLWMCETQEAGGELNAVLALAAWYSELVIVWAAYVEGQSVTS